MFTVSVAEKNKKWGQSLARVENRNINVRLVYTSRKFWLFYLIFINKTPFMPKLKKSEFAIEYSTWLVLKTEISMYV